MSKKIKVGIMVRTKISGIAFIQSEEFETEAEALIWTNRQVQMWIVAENAIPNRTFRVIGNTEFKSLQDEMRLVSSDGDEFWAGVDTATRLEWSKDRLRDSLKKIIEGVETRH